MKTIVVCGDLVWDTQIARLSFDPKGYFQPHLQSQLVNRYGGAWYLDDVIMQAIAAEKLDALVIAPHRVKHVEIEDNTGDSLGVAKGFSVWEWIEGKEQAAKAKVVRKGDAESVQFKWKGGEADPGAWRIKEFLGCQQAQWTDNKNKDRRCPAIAEAPTKPDLVVVDDLGLGFGHQEHCWPGCLSDPTNPVLMKATPPFDTPLWRRLLARAGEPNVTVVVAAAALRDAGARLSRGLSWDQTLREVKDEFGPDGIGWPLRSCARVVVSFGRSGAAVFSCAPRSPEETKRKPAQLRFERLLFDPDHLEETWAPGLPGTTFGATSALAATMATYLLQDRPSSSHLPVSRGLAAARELHRMGGGHNEGEFDPKAAEAKIFALDSERPAEKLFRSAFPRELLDHPVLAKPEDLPPLEEQSLLTDILGLTPEFLSVTAQDLVRSGPKNPLQSVPRLEYGNYFTVDREEIERLNTVRNLIHDYRRNTADSRPLSLGVFGPPGAGKSFAIKELSQSLFGKEQAVIEFNLSQFESLDALHEAFHEVRDRSVQGKLPLVFWDEFDSMRDTTPLGWLKEFLAPMQDAKFVAKGRAHPFGKCIFIFAGGTCATFKEFTRPIDPEARPSGESESAKMTPEELAAAEQSFKRVKGTDFVSRLRGYVNIKGPNPTTAKGDEVHVIRRALLLRSLIERHHPQLLNPVNRKLVVGSTVLNAFLHVGDGRKGDGYLHGARSMEAIVSLSRLRGGRHFGPSELPGRELLQLHVTSDFMEKVTDKSQYHLSMEDIEDLAARKHSLWMNSKKEQGFVWGAERNNEAQPPTHHWLKPYGELDDEGKDANLKPAQLTPLRLAALGYRICHADHATGEIVPDEEPLPLEVLARSEHRRWMRQRLLQGYAWSEGTSDDALLLHQDICKFSALARQEARLDHQIVSAIRDFLKHNRLVLVKVKP